MLYCALQYEFPSANKVISKHLGTWEWDLQKDGSGAFTSQNQFWGLFKNHITLQTIKLFQTLWPYYI